MPEYYSQFGEAAGAAMAHNARMAAQTTEAQRFREQLTAAAPAQSAQPLPDEQHAAIRTRHEAATSGTWYLQPHYGPTFVASESAGYEHGIGDMDFGVGDQADADREFVLNAHGDMEQLLAELDRLRAERDQARAQLADAIVAGLTAMHDHPETAERNRSGLRMAMRNVHRFADRTARES